MASSLVSATLESSPHDFLQPSLELHSAALALAKFYLDPVAAAVSSHQQSRLDVLGQDRKRKRDYEDLRRSALRLKHLTLPGFDSNQVWEQARRIIDGLNQQVVQANEERGNEGVTVTSEGESGDSDQGDSDDASSESGVEENRALDSTGPEEAADDPSSDEDIEEDDESASSDRDPKSRKTSGVLVKDRFGLNDGFFSIDEFNRRTEGWEYGDARGDGDAEAASDEEDIDWDINPMDIDPDAADEGSVNESGSDDEDGPVFEDFDSSRDSDAGEGDPMEEDATGNANNIMYAEFFEPPPRKAPKKAKAKKNHHPLPAPESDRDIEETIAMVGRDIFSDEEKEDELPAGASAHEQRKAAIVAQIRELEAENVSKKPWTLAGEARAHDRPINAVLEEDLDFERAGKPVPVATKETSEIIEELIKRRILASQFDDVRRRLPEEAIRMTSGRGASDKLAQSLEAPQRRGLADIYEEEYLRKNDPAFVDQKDEKTTKEHAEIEELWKDIVHKLDSLASFRYRPKRDDITISVRADAPAMSLEDARPSGVGGAVGTLSQLAPQEIYSAAGERVAGKVVTRGGEVVAREELTREERRRRRRRDKERAKKAGRSGPEAGKGESTKARDAKALVGQLKAGDVKVIGKEGKVKRVDGKDIQTARRGGASLKL
jgi:U3 small nucleolar RNA-associated protein MPP10